MFVDGIGIVGGMLTAFVLVLSWIGVWLNGKTPIAWGHIAIQSAIAGLGLGVLFGGYWWAEIKHQCRAPVDNVLPEERWDDCRKEGVGRFILKRVVTLVGLCVMLWPVGFGLLAWWNDERFKWESHLASGVQVGIVTGVVLAISEWRENERLWRKWKETGGRRAH